jgi:hypothetical protein
VCSRVGDTDPAADGTNQGQARSPASQCAPGGRDGPVDEFNPLLGTRELVSCLLSPAPALFSASPSVRSVSYRSALIPRISHTRP